MRVQTNHRSRLGTFILCLALAAASQGGTALAVTSAPAAHPATGTRTMSAANVRDHRKLPKPAHKTTVAPAFAAAGAKSANSPAAVRPGSADPAAQPAVSAPFTQCPAVGQDSSCEILLQVGDDGTAILADPSQGPFDGSDDTLVGVLNSSSQALANVQIASDTDVFGFDGDGICSGYTPGPPACPYGPTGYEGPDTSFSNISADQSGGTVDFATPLSPGQSTYFSLEEALSATSVVVGGPTSAEAGGAPNPSEKDDDCDDGEPVNCATGEYWTQSTDFSIPGSGVPLNLTRGYTSALAATDGPFGFGWSDSYGMHLTTDAAGYVTVDQENGSSVTFSPNGSGGFTAPPWVLADLIVNTDGSYTFHRDTNTVSYTFSAAGSLLAETDPNGETTHLDYTGAQVTSVVDPAGRSLTFGYTGGNVTKVTDPLGRTVSFTYDAAGDLSSSTNSLGRTWAYTYDANHLLLTATDPRSGKSTNSYDSSGRVVAQTDPKGAKTTWSYSGNAASSGGGTTTITDPDGNVTVENYTDLELTSLSQGVGTSAQATTTYTHDPSTLGTSSETNPDGNTTQNSYDADGNLISTTDPLGRNPYYEYDNYGEVTFSSSPLNEVSTYDYDANGNLDTAVDALGQQTGYAYADPAHPGAATTITDPDGDVTTLTYNAYGDVATKTVTVSPGVTEKTSYTYDADGDLLCFAGGVANASSISCPATGSAHVAGTTSYTYDSAGEQTSTTSPTGSTTSESLDGDGNVASSTDAKGDTTTFTYNADNELTATNLPGGLSTSSTYDADGNTLTQIDGTGATTAYTYTPLRLLASTTDPLGRKTTYGYDLAGNRVSLTNPSGQITTSTYDADNELIGLTYSDGKTPNVTYTYTGDGTRATMTDGTGTTSYSYDADQRLTKDTNGAAAPVGYGYDADGNLTTLTYPNGQNVTRTFNGAGDLTSVRDWLGDTTSFDYDADENPTSDTYPNSVLASATYNAADQLTGITDTHGSTTLASFGYTRDANGQATTAAETGVPGSTTPATPVTYGYTQLNQLASAAGSAYTYNGAQGITRLANGTTQTYDAADELLSSTAPGTPSGSPALDTLVNGTEESAASPVTSPPISTAGGNELLLAFVSADGPSGQTQQVSAVTGGGLTWKPVSQANGTKGTGTAEVWEAYATKPLSAVTISASLQIKKWDAGITVAAFTGAAPAVGATAAAGSRKGSPSVTLTTTAPGSLVWAAGHNWSTAAAESPAAGQSVVTQDLDTRINDTYWVQKTTNPVAASGAAVTIADSTPTDARWELAAVEIPAASPGTGGGSGATTTYGYDAQGDRTSATSAAGATTLAYDQAERLTSDSGATYAYNGDGLLSAETATGKGSPAYTWDQDGSVPLLLSDGTTSYIYGPNDQPIEQITGSTPTYLQGDQQGSTRLVTDSSGNVAGSYSYDAYGNVVGHSGTATSALQYAGQYTDPASGLSYLRARFYDPKTAQFLSVDPLAAQTGSRYGYAADNPVNFTDPTGLCPPCDDLEDAMNEEASRIQQKADNLINNPLNLPLYGPNKTVQSHINPFNGYQSHLRSLINDYIDSGCGDLEDLPDNVLEQATRPVPVDIPPLPQPGSQQAGNPANSNPSSSSSASDDSSSGGINWGHVIIGGFVIVGIGAFIYFTGGAGALVLAGA